MPNLGLGLNIDNAIVSSRAFDADYQAVLTRASSLGYTLPSASVQTKQNQPK